jgi:hypothetical protein
MGPADIVGDRFNEIIARCGESGRPDGFSEADRVIYYVVSTRCAIDMDGFSSVFEQLLTKDELLFLIASLEALGRPALAEVFRKCHSALRRVGFYDKPYAMCHEFGSEFEEELAGYESLLDESDPSMWDLDDKLRDLIA